LSDMSDTLSVIQRRPVGGSFGAFVARFQTSRNRYRIIT